MDEHIIIFFVFWLPVLGLLWYYEYQNKRRNKFFDDNFNSQPDDMKAVIKRFEELFEQRAAIHHYGEMRIIRLEDGHLFRIAHGDWKSTIDDFIML